MGLNDLRRAEKEHIAESNAKYEKEEALKEKERISFSHPSERFNMIQEKAENGMPEAEAIGVDKKARSLVRKNQLSEMGYDMWPIEDIYPNPENPYSIDEKSIEALADMIDESAEITPLIVEETDDGMMIVDGQRRFEACKVLLARDDAKLKPHMLPVKIYKKGELTQADRDFIMHSQNIGQRDMTPSERARGIAVIADELTKRRKTDKNLRAVKARDYIAEKTDMSPRNAQIYINIGKKLNDSGLELLDNKKITLKQASKISSLESTIQDVLNKKIKDGTIAKSDIDEAIEKTIQGDFEVENLIEENSAPNTEQLANSQNKENSQTEKDADWYIKKANSALKKACSVQTEASKMRLGELQDLIKELLKIQEKLENQNYEENEIL